MPQYPVSQITKWHMISLKVHEMIVFQEESAPHYG